MVTGTEGSLYEQVVDITYDYLGPAARRFVAREIETHLKKEPEQLTTADIPILLDWSKLAIALLTDDKEMVGDYTRRILKLTEYHNG